jgi:hypothetical protein
MTPEQRETLANHASFICSYTSPGDDVRATADAIAAAIKQIEKLEKGVKASIQHLSEGGDNSAYLLDVLFTALEGRDEPEGGAS